MYYSGKGRWCWAWRSEQFTEESPPPFATLPLLLLSRFSRVPLCDPGSSVPGTLQARMLEWVAISFSSTCIHAKLLQLCPTVCNSDICQTHFWGRWLIFKDGNQNFPGDPVVKNPRSDTENVGLIPAQGTKIHMQLESLWVATAELKCSRVCSLQQEKPTHTTKEPTCRKGRPSTASPAGPQIKNSRKEEQI